VDAFSFLLCTRLIEKKGQCQGTTEASFALIDSPLQGRQVELTIDDVGNYLGPTSIGWLLEGTDRCRQRYKYGQIFDTPYQVFQTIDFQFQSRLISSTTVVEV
jgi:hypothetical protein